MSKAKIDRIETDSLVAKSGTKLDSLGRFGATTVIPWMRLMGLRTLSSKSVAFGMNVFPVVSYVEMDGIDKVKEFPEELKTLRQNLARPLGAILNACQAETITLEESSQEIIEQMLPTWKMLSGAANGPADAGPVGPPEV